MEEQIKVINPNDLLSETVTLKNLGYRLVCISGKTKNGTEITYSFDKEYDFVHLRLTDLSDDTEVDSISSIYPFSFLYENEIKELFGVKIVNIGLDFNGTLYKTSVKTPFNVKKENE